MMTVQRRILPIAEILGLLEQVDECQQEIRNIDRQYGLEKSGVDEKYLQVIQPWFDKRGEHIAVVPSFWYLAFLNHHSVSAFPFDLRFVHGGGVSSENPHKDHRSRKTIRINHFIMTRFAIYCITKDAPTYWSQIFTFKWLSNDLEI